MERVSANRSPWSRASRLGAFFTLALISFLALHEVGVVIGDLSVGGRSYSADSLFALTQVWHAGTAMKAWAQASCSGIAVKNWLWWQLAFDLPFILGYAGLGAGASRRWPKLGLGRWVIGLVIVDLIEDGLTALAVGLLPNAGASNCPPPAAAQSAFYHHPAPLLLLGLATTVKTILIVVVVSRLLWVVVREDPSHERFRQVVTALGMQRFVAGVVVLLAALLLVPGSPILEQGIDVERAWVLGGAPTPGVFAALWGLGLIVVLACALRYIASVRVAPFEIRAREEIRVGEEAADPLLRASAQPEHPERTTIWWLIGAVVVSAAVWGLGTTGWIRLYRPAFYAMVGVLIAAPLVSLPLLLFSSRRAPTAPVDVVNEAPRRRAFRAGRALAWSVPAVVLVGICRSMVAPMILLPRGPAWTCGVVFAAAGLVAIGYVYGWVLRGTEFALHGDRDGGDGGFWYWLDPQLVGARGGETARVPGLLMSLLPAGLVTVVCGALLLLLPVHTSRLVGVMGTVGLSLLLLAAFYALLQIIAQLVEPPYVFRRLGILRAPVLTVVVLIGTLSTTLGATTSQHTIRPPADVVGQDDRPTLAAAFTDWSNDHTTADCAIRVPGTDPNDLVQPLVMVAAEGGGVRAAWWTVDAMSSLTSTACGRKAVFLTSAVSGGAIGAAVMAASAHPYSQMHALAGPDALAAAIDGLFSRDLMAGTFGISIRAADGPAGTRFPDRATLIEQTWERQIHGLAAPFPGHDPAIDEVPWHTVYNGTSVAHTCRILISDVKLSTQTGCTAAGNPVPGSYDLFSAAPCDLGLRASTASLLAGRFPYVTPSGVISSCARPAHFLDQDIDGGYSENTGIDTINSALDQLMPSIRAWNLGALNAGKPLIAPIVIYLHNSVVASVGAEPQAPSPKPEVVIPPLNSSDSSSLGEPATLLQHAAATAADWIPDTTDPQLDARAGALRSGFLQALQNSTQAVTVAPEKEPALALPLGWTLSKALEHSMDCAYNAYLTQPIVPDGPSSGYDSLLLNWKTQMTFPLDQPKACQPA